MATLEQDTQVSKANSGKSWRSGGYLLALHERTTPADPPVLVSR